MKKKLIYKIKRSDGLFSTGGMTPHFDKDGKSWTTLGSLKNHLNLVMDTHKYSKLADFYRNCELITIEMTPSIINTASLDTVLLEQEKLRAKKTARIKEASEKAKREQELAELQRLQAKYSNSYRI